MRRSPSLAAIACLTAALASCGTHPTTTPASPTSANPHQRAIADAADIISAFPVPSGAVRAARAPSALLTAPPVGPAATPDVATATQWWTAPGDPQAVLAWVTAHVPVGFGPAGPGQAANEWFEQFSLPPVPGVLTQRWLLVAAVGDGTGRTAIRVDAQVVWLPAKSSAERIPPSATVVTVAPLPEFVPNSARPRPPGPPVTITDPAKVARIAALIDGLPVFPPGTFSCPAGVSGGIRLTFRASKDGPVLAVVTADSSGCQVVSVVIDGHHQPALAGSASLQGDMQAIAGVHWR